MVSNGGRNGDYPKEPEVGHTSGLGLFLLVNGEGEAPAEPPLSGSFALPIERPKISMPTQFHQIRFMPLADAKHRIADGDLLLFRRRSPISIAGRGTHSHAAKAAWWEGDLFCVEV